MNNPWRLEGGYEFFGFCSGASLACACASWRDALGTWRRTAKALSLDLPRGRSAWKSRGKQFWNGPDASRAMLVARRHYPALEALDVRGCCVASGILQDLPKAFPRLVSLDVRGCPMGEVWVRRRWGPAPGEPRRLEEEEAEEDCGTATRGWHLRRCGPTPKAVDGFAAAGVAVACSELELSVRLDADGRVARFRVRATMRTKRFFEEYARRLDLRLSFLEFSLGGRPVPRDGCVGALRRDAAIHCRERSLGAQQAYIQQQLEHQRGQVEAQLNQREADLEWISRQLAKCAADAEREAEELGAAKDEWRAELQRHVDLARSLRDLLAQVRDQIAELTDLLGQLREQQDLITNQILQTNLLDLGANNVPPPPPYVVQQAQPPQ